MATSARSADKWARRLGVTIGLAAIAVAATLSAVDGGGGRILGADVTFASAPTGELSVSPVGPFVQGLGLKPGSARAPATGDLEVRNQTASTLEVFVRAVPSIADLDEIMTVDVSAEGAAVFHGSLGSLRSWTTTGFVLESGHTATLHLDARIPAGVAGGYEGRIDDIGVQLMTAVAGD